MGFSESIEFLKGIEGAGEHVEAILAHETTLKNESIGHRKKAGEYAPTVEKYASLSKALADSGLDLTTDIAEQIASLKGGVSKATDEATRKLSSLEKQIAEIKQEKEQAVIKSKRKSAEAKLLPTLADNFYNSGSMFKALLADGLIDFEDEDNPKIKIGDSSFEISDGIAKLRDHADFKDGAKNIQKAGTGTSGSNTGSKATDREDKMAFIKSRGKTF